MPPLRESPGYLRHHLEKYADDEEIQKLENEVALLNPPSVKTSKPNHLAENRVKSADPAARRPQSTAADVDKSHLRAHSAGRAARATTNGRANFQQVPVINLEVTFVRYAMLLPLSV